MGDDEAAATPVTVVKNEPVGATVPVANDVVVVKKLGVGLRLVMTGMGLLAECKRHGETTRG